MNHKLPTLKIIAAAAFFAWSNKAEFLRATAVPTLMLVVMWAVWAVYSDVLSPYSSWAVLLGYGLGFSFLAVTCHRLILIDDADRYRPFNAKPGYRELKFLAWVIAVYAIKALLVFFTQVVVQNVGLAGEGGQVSDWATQIAAIPGLYVFARLSLVFPAAAIDRKTSLRWSWMRTRGNGWRMFVVVCLFPWLTSMLIWLVWREKATLPEQVILSILAILGLAIEIIVLSFTYRELAKQYAHHRQLKPGETAVTLTDEFHEPARDGKGGKLYGALKVVAFFVISFLLVASLHPRVADCSSELLGKATSPDGKYSAALLDKTCKDSKAGQGLVLDIAGSASPQTIYSFPLSRTGANDATLVWISDRRLLVRHANSREWADVPVLIDDVQIAFE